MKRLILAALALLAAQLGQAAGAAAQPALLFDIGSGRVLIAEEAGRPWYPASLTKLMTAYLVFDAVHAGRLRLNQTFAISKNAVRGGGHGASRYGAKPGQRMSVDRMLAFLLVRSDADMAVALAEAVAGGEARFVRMMNATAKRLGMTGTHFVNPHGMGDPRQVTTARDMGMLAMGLYHHFLKRHPSWWRYFSAPYVLKGKRRQKNRNKLLFMMKGANGMKTGFLCASGFNLLATARRGGRTLAVVVMGRKTAYTRASFARILLEEGFRALEQGRGAPSGPILTQLRNGRGAPPDLSGGVCRGRTVRMAELERPEGWAVAIGAYNVSVNAEAALEAELLAARLLHRPLPRGVARLPEARKYAGLVWKLDQDTALALCGRARAHRTDCRVYPPPALSQLAAAVRAARLARERRKLRRAGKTAMKRRGNFAASR